MTLKNFVGVILVFGLFGLGGCSGKKTDQKDDPQSTITSAESQIPDDIARAFEVKDAVSPDFPTMLVPPKLLATAPPSETEKESSQTKKDSKKSSKKSKRGESGPAPAAISSAPSQPATVDGLVIPNRRPSYDPIRVGEKVWLDVNWLHTNAGEFLLEVLPHKFIKNRKVYNFKGLATTSSLFAVFYKVEDWVETFVDYEGWFPYKFQLYGNETKHLRNTIELFDHAKKRQYVYNYDKRVQTGEVHEEKKETDLSQFSQDSLSALYYVRTQKLDVGSIVRFPMTTAGEQWEMEVRVLGKEDCSTGMGARPSIKLKVDTRFHGVLRQQGDQFLWLSDDEHRHLLRFEAKVKIGWITGVAKKIELGTAP